MTCTTNEDLSSMVETNLKLTPGLSRHRKTELLPDSGFIAGVYGVCDNLGIESCKTGADVPVRHGKTVLGKGTQ